MTEYLTVQQIANEVADRLKSWSGTQAEFAEAIGVAPSYVSMLLNGRHTIGPQILRGLGYDPTPHYAKSPASKCCNCGDPSDQKFCGMCREMGCE